MSFTLRMIITGICAYVPIISKATSKKMEGAGKIPTPADAEKMCVVMIDANNHERKALDEYDLMRHRAFVQIKAKYIANGLRPSATRDHDPELVWYFDRERLSIDTDSCTEFNYDWSSKSLSDMHNVPEMCILANMGGPIETGCLSSKNPTTGKGKFEKFEIAGQMIVEQGVVKCPCVEREEWWFDETMDGQRYFRKFSDQILVEMEVDTYAVLKFKSLSGSKKFTEVVPLTPVDGKIELIVGNIPDHNPLAWKPHSTTVDPKDTDIKWLYHLCRYRSKIKNELGTGKCRRQLPFPVTDRAVRPNKCMGVQFPLVVEEP